jgi:hypothetical protein
MSRFIQRVSFLLLVMAPLVSLKRFDSFMAEDIFLVDGKVYRGVLETRRNLIDAITHPAVNMTLQTAEEANYLKFHRCFGDIALHNTKHSKIIYSS